MASVEKRQSSPLTLKLTSAWFSAELPAALIEISQAFSLTYSLSCKDELM